MKNPMQRARDDLKAAYAQQRQGNHKPLTDLICRRYTLPSGHGLDVTLKIWDPQIMRNIDNFFTWLEAQHRAFTEGGQSLIGFNTCLEEAIATWYDMRSSSPLWQERWPQLTAFAELAPEELRSAASKPHTKRAAVLR